MRGATDLLASDQLRSFPSLLREVRAISERRLQKRSAAEESKAVCVENHRGITRAALCFRTPKQVRSTNSKSVAKLIGKTISHYRILARLGIGGMGVIYRAQDVRLGRQVAVKFASEEFYSGAARDHFRSEARAASAVNHPNICQVYDIGEFGCRPFLVMELLSGRTLKDLVEGPLAVEVFLNLAIQIADGLNAVHSSGIVHRDITPSNIHVSNTGCVKILDFGLAEFPTGLNPEFNYSEKHHEQMGGGPESACGTLPYMSPEQILGEPSDPRADLFSFGVVLYEMLTGHRPFQGRTSAALLDALLHKPIIPPSVFRPEVPDGLEKLVEKALEKDPEYRCQSAAEVLADLKRMQRDLRLGRVEPSEQRSPYGLAAHARQSGAVVLRKVGRRNPVH